MIVVKALRTSKWNHVWWWSEGLDWKAKVKKGLAALLIAYKLTTDNLWEHWLYCDVITLYPHQLS